MAAEVAITTVTQESDSRTGVIVRGLRQAQRKTLGDLVGPRMSQRRLELIEEGIEPSPHEVLILAAALDLRQAPHVLYEGLGPAQGQQIRHDLTEAAALVTRGQHAQARSLYQKVLADPALGSRPDLWRLAELGLAGTLEATGELAAAIDRLQYLLAVLTPHIDPAPAAAFQDRGLSEQRAAAAIALSRCLREVGDLAGSARVAETALNVEMAESWSDRAVELGAALLATWLEQCAQPPGPELVACQALAGLLVKAAGRLATPRALLAACQRAAAVAMLAGDAQGGRHLAARAMAVSRQARATLSTARWQVELVLDLPLVSVQELRQARRWLREVDAARDGGVPAALDQAYELLARARVALAEGDAAVAQRLAGQVAGSCPEARMLGVGAQLVIGQALRLQKRPREAAPSLQAAAEHLAGMAAPARAAQAFAAAALEWERCGDQVAAAAADRRALEVIGVG